MRRPGPGVLPAAVGASAIAACCLLWAQTARADELDRCVASAAELMRAAGARPLGGGRAGFLSEGERLTEVVQLHRAGCVAFLAVGHRRVHDLDLILRTDGGMVLARDVEVDAHAYVRYCGAEGLRLAVTVEMFKGLGEVRLLAFRDAPPALPHGYRDAGACFAIGGGMRRPSADVGPEAPGPSADDALARLSAPLLELGYVPRGEVLSGRVSQRGQSVLRVSLRPGVCHAVVAAGESTLSDLDVFVTAGGRAVAADDSRRSGAVARVCPTRASAHEVLVRAFAGAGRFAARVLELGPPELPAPAGLEGAARAAYGETAARLRARGLGARLLGWGWAAGATRVSFPFEVEAGRCYAFAGVPADEARAADLDLSVLEEDGVPVAWDLGPGDPMVFHCAEVTRTLRVVGKLWGGAGLFALLAGTERP